MRDADPKLADIPLGVGNFPMQLIVQRLETLGKFNGDLPLGGEQKIAFFSNKKRYLELLFQLVYLMADGRLRQREQLGGLGEVFLFCNRQKRIDFCIDHEEIPSLN